MRQARRAGRKKDRGAGFGIAGRRLTIDRGPQQGWLRRQRPPVTGGKASPGMHTPGTQIDHDPPSHVGGCQAARAASSREDHAARLEPIELSEMLITPRIGMERHMHDAGQGTGQIDDDPVG